MFVSFFLFSPSHEARLLLHLSLRLSGELLFADEKFLPMMQDCVMTSEKM